MTISRLALSLALLPTIAHPQILGFGGPGNYDECITESMQGVTSDVAARAIMQSCRRQFPPEQVDSRELTRDELAQVTGRGRRSILRTLGTMFMGDIYNGNANLTITELTISITIRVDDEDVTRRYTRPVTIRPQSTAQVSTSILDEEGLFTWYIAGAKGHE